MSSRHKLWAGVALFGAVLGPALTMSSGASADVTRLVVTSAFEIGPYDGKEYRYIQGTLLGTAPGGAYSVPIELMFPIAADDFSGVAVVDFVLTGLVRQSPEGWPPEGGRPFATWPYFGENYLFASGHMVVSIMYRKDNLATLGNGLIGAQTDAAEIIRDAAAVARDPSLLHVSQARTPAAATYVIATGYSGSAQNVRSWFSAGLNQAEGTPVFDGALLLSARQLNCTNLATGETTPCDPTRTDGAKIISVFNETDIESRGPALRGETESYRHIEVAGVSHLPSTILDWRAFGAPDQNPVDTAPVFRAALANLVAWVADGTAPPPSVYIDIPAEPTRMFDEAPFWDAARDVDGNALGGVRLPHMPGGQGVGAPLGVYHGTDDRPGAFNVIAGTFAPFTTEQIRSRYPTRAAYVAAVTAAAVQLVADRFILRADADAYVAAARAAAFWN